MDVIGKIAESFPLGDHGLGIVFEQEPAFGLPWHLCVKVVCPDGTSFDAEATGNWIRRTRGELVMLNLANRSMEEVPIGSIVYFLGPGSGGIRNG